MFENNEFNDPIQVINNPIENNNKQSQSNIESIEKYINEILSEQPLIKKEFTSKKRLLRTRNSNLKRNDSN